MDIHIGEIIEKRARELKIGATELGKLIGKGRTTVHLHFSEPSLHSNLLEKYSKALRINLFQILSEDLNREMGIEPGVVHDNTPEYGTKSDDLKKVGVTFYINVDSVEEFKEGFEELISRKSKKE